MIMKNCTPVTYTWDEFRDTGLLWFINSILHIFGWEIVLFITDNKVVYAYPARVRYRGFSEDINDNGYQKVGQYLSENGKKLYSEAWSTDREDGYCNYAE